MMKLIFVLCDHILWDKSAVSLSEMLRRTVRLSVNFPSTKKPEHVASPMFIHKTQDCDLCLVCVKKSF